MSPERIPRYAIGFSSLLDEDSGTRLTPSGIISPALAGTMYRIGPSRFEINGQTVSHWLDGFATVSSVEFGTHGITYRHRFVASNWYKRALIDDALPPEGFASGQSHPGRHPANDNTNMNMIMWRGQMELLCNTPQSILVDAVTLATERTQRRTGVTRSMDRYCACSPHPIVDQQTGERFDLSLSSRDPAGYIVTVTNPAGKMHRLCHIPSSRLGYMHSFSVTSRWIVLVETPFTANPRSLNSLRRPYLRNFVWDAARGTRILIADRRTGVLKATLAARPLFVLHHINAWDDGEQVTVDIAAYADPSILGRLAFSRGEAPAGDFPCPLATRLTVDLAQKRVSCVPLKCPPGEFCTVDPRYERQPYATLFVAGSTRPGEPIDRLCRCDMPTGLSTCWASDNCMPGAPVFVPASADAPQGTGWLLSIVLDVQQKRSFLLILNSTTMTEEARAWLPHALPFGLHTIFVPREVTP
jgi:beta,beta-carotene 9',10'-dioxygenase